MAQGSFANELRTFQYVIVNGSGPSMNLPVARLYIVEAKSAKNRGGLVEATPDYGFRMVDADGNLVCEIAPGYWPFAKKAIEATAEFHSPACAEDCATEIGALTPLKGDNDGE